MLLVAASLWWGKDLSWSLLALAPAAGVLGLLLALLAVLAATGRKPVNQRAVEDALAARDGLGSPDKDASLALAMTIGAISGVDTMSEATKGDFHKNVLTLEIREASPPTSRSAPSASTRSPPRPLAPTHWVPTKAAAGSSLSTRSRSPTPRNAG